MKLALGTVQFGVEYGVANRSGRVPITEVGRILGYAQESGIDTLDTAAAYGCSESVLGQAGVSGFRVITKLPSYPGGPECPERWVERIATESLSKLRLNHLSGIMLHRPCELLDNGGEQLYAALSRLKEHGLVKSIGVSVYGPEELERLVPHFDFDIVQAPMNIVDRRLLQTGWLEKLHAKNVEVHIRSAFLQGLLLMESSKRPNYFEPWKHIFQRYERWVKESKISKLEACLGWLGGVQSIDRVVVGIDSTTQLKEIVAASGAFIPEPPESIASNDPLLINPASWQL